MQAEPHSIDPPRCDHPVIAITVRVPTSYDFARYPLPDGVGLSGYPSDTDEVAVVVKCLHCEAQAQGYWNPQHGQRQFWLYVEAMQRSINHDEQVRNEVGE